MYRNPLYFMLNNEGERTHYDPFRMTDKCINKGCDNQITYHEHGTTEYFCKECFENRIRRISNGNDN